MNLSTSGWVFSFYATTMMVPDVGSSGTGQHVDPSDAPAVFAGSQVTQVTVALGIRSPSDDL